MVIYGGRADKKGAQPVATPLQSKANFVLNCLESSLQEVWDIDVIINSC